MKGRPGALLLAITLSCYAQTAAELKQKAAELRARGDAAGALTLLLRAEETGEKSASLQDEIGFLLAVQQQHAGAVERFERSIRLDPSYAPAHYHLGVAKWLANERSAALESLRTAVQLDGANIEYVLRYATALYDLEQFSAAAAEANKVIKTRSGDSRIWTVLGRSHQRSGNRAEAVRAFREVVRLEPRNVGARSDVGFLLIEEGSADKALTELQEALRIDPGHVPTLLNIGFAYLQKGELQRAIAQYRDVVAKSPGLAVARHNLGLALKQNDDLEAAKEELRNAVKLDPSLAEAHYTLGIAHWQSGEFDDAAHALRAAVAARPAFSDAHAMLGTVLKQAGNLQSAIDALREAIRLDPGSPGPYNTLGQVLRLRGEIEESKLAFAEGTRAMRRREAEQKVMFDRGRTEGIRQVPR